MVIEPKTVVEQDLIELAAPRSVLADAEALVEVREADRATETGELLRGVAAVRAPRPQRRGATRQPDQPSAP